MPPAQKLEIRLSHLDDLFRAPDISPLAADYRPISGINQLINDLQGRRSNTPLTLSLVLPNSTTVQTTPAAVKAALHRYCDHQITEAQTHQRIEYRATLNNVLTGIVILAVSLGIGTSITYADFTNTGLRNLLVNTISILGSVALWAPMDSLLYGRQEARRTIRTLTLIKAMAIDVRFEG